MRLPKPLQARTRLWLLLGAALPVLAACAADAPQDFLNRQAGPVAREADRIWDITFAIAIGVFVIVEGLILFALFRFRERPDRRAKQFHGNPRLEVVLVLVPALILGGLAIPTVRTIFTQAVEPAGALQVRLIGHQFWWEFQYDTDGDGSPDFETANEVHVPVGQPVRFRIEGDPETRDVIHSFWVPLLGGAQDVIPGRVNLLTLEADEPGTYLGQCKEFCGLSHANMRVRLVAEPPEDFERWADSQSRPIATTAGAAEGARMFVTGDDGAFTACASCHTINGLEVDGQPAGGTLGPDLTHLADRATFAGAMFDLNEANLRQWLQDPPAMKPGVRMPDLGLTSEQIDALVAFLMGLE